MKSRTLTQFTPALIIGHATQQNGFSFVTDSSTGTIVKTGSEETITSWVANEKNRADDASQPVSIERVHGGFAFPGLTDAHSHPLLFSTMGMQKFVFLYDCKSKQEILQALAEASADPERDQSKSIIAIGWHRGLVQDLTGDNVADAVGNKKTAVFELSFHGAIVSPAMATIIQQEAEKLPTTLGGFLHSDGEATENFAMIALNYADDEYDVDEKRKAIKQGLLHMFSTGVTSVHDMCSVSMSRLLNGLELRQEWSDNENTPFPITQLYVNRLQLTEIAQLVEDGTLSHDDVSNLLELKLFADGSLGSHTALMERRYDDGQDNGLIFDTESQISSALDLATELGITKVAIHAIGDAAINKAIGTATTWLSWKAKNQFRFEHFELPTAEAMIRASRPGVAVVPQPNFLLDYRYADRLGDRVKRLCPHRSILDHNITMMLGTDCMPPSMLFAIYLATHAEEHCQRISLEEAIYAATKPAAQWEGTSRGTIEEGQTADIVIADEKLFDELSAGPPDVRSYEEGPTANAKAAELEGHIQRVYRSGKLVHKRP